MPSRPGSVRLDLDGGSIALATDRAMFSPNALDAGTRILLDHVPRPPQGDLQLADIGCGYGPIAIALALRSPQATIWAVDVNERALACCAHNAKLAGVEDRVHAVLPQDFPDNITLDGLWSNPPIRIGKQALYELLSRWLDTLHPASFAHLVVHKNLGSDSLAKWLTTRGQNVTRLTSVDGYRILQVNGRDEMPRESTTP